MDHQYNICLPQMSQKMFETFILLETQRPFVENKMDILTLLIKVSPFWLIRWYTHVLSN